MFKTNPKIEDIEIKVGQEWEIKNDECLDLAFANNPTFSFIKIIKEAETPLGGPGKRCEVFPHDGYYHQAVNNGTIVMYEFAIKKNYNIYSQEEPQATDDEEEVLNPDDLSGGRPKKTRKRKRKRRKKTRKRRKRKTKRRKKRRYTKRIQNVKEILSDKCSPKKEGEILKFTCYTKASLYRLKNIWNARHGDVKIKTNDPKSIWDFLSSHMADTCERESCWLKKNWINQKLPKSVIDNTFAPEQPNSWKRKPTEWLTSIDILDVMKQYERTYKNFEFMGPSPIDFDTHKLYGECVWEELCKISLKDLISKGKTQIGIIFNTDKHTEPGSHWVALFIDCKKKSIYYFDSYADDAPKEVRVLGKRLQKQSEALGKRYKYIENRKRHQWSNSECGMYCLFFIIELLKGRSFNKIETKRIDDKFMKKLRNIYFNKI